MSVQTSSLMVFENEESERQLSLKIEMQSNLRRRKSQRPIEKLLKKQS